MIFYTKLYQPYSLYFMLFQLSVNHCIVSSTSEAFLHIEGYFLLGALPSIGKNKTGQSCKSLNEDSLVLVDSIYYAVSDINSKPELLSNISLGTEIRDTCSEKRPATHQALAFVRGSKLQSLDSTSEENKPIVAVITDSLDKEVSALLEIFNVPHIRLHVTKHSMVNFTKDTASFGSMASVSFYKALALVDLIKTFENWRAVSVVYSNELQGEFRIFEALAEESNICLSLASDLRRATVNETINKLLTEFMSSVILLFTVAVETVQLFAALKSYPFHERSRLTWLIAGEWTEKIVDVEDVVDGALIVDPMFPFLEEMNNFYRRHPSKSETFSMNNIDFSLKYSDKEIYNGKKLYPNSRLYDSPKRGLSDRVAKIQAVVNSIHLFAKAFNSLFKASCTSGSFLRCKPYFQSLNRKNLIDKLQQFYNINYRFSTSLFLDEKDLKQNTFALLNYQKNFKFKLKMVGTWKQSWFINTKEIQWQNGSKKIPESTCVYPCPAGHVSVPRNDRKCCWTCSPCNNNQIVKNNSFCEDCRRGFWPSEDLKSCKFNLLDVLLKGLLYFLSIIVVFFMSVL